MSQLQTYKDCIGKQLEEVELLSSIYCTPGEFHMFDAGVISDFHEFLSASDSEDSIKLLQSNLDYNIKLNVLVGNKEEKLDVRMELPHLYPLIEHAIVTVHTTLLTKAKELNFKKSIEGFIVSLDKEETYIYQVLSWIQEQFDVVIKRDDSEFEELAVESASGVGVGDGSTGGEALIDFERLWIYSHHIKAKSKRQEILKSARTLNLSGFLRPGKPGIICVEGEKTNVQEFWQNIKSLHWQKISICKTEASPRKPLDKLDKLRRFEGFREQIFGFADADNEDCVMDMSQFIKFLESHNSAYMKKELFGLD